MLDIYRGAVINLSLHIDDNTRLIRQLLGADIIKSSFASNDILDISIGDHIVYDSINYYINSLPNVKKNATISFDYDITFESETYELLKTQFLDLDDNSDFDLVGNLETFIDLIVTNMNRTHSGWAKGTCDQTNADYKLLNFSKANCMQALQKLCTEFEGEFYFTGKNICFTDKAGSDSGLTFMYKQGLRNIQRNTLSEKNIITRLYAFGSEKNLASDYRSHSRRLKFVLVGGESYLEKYITATTWASATAYILKDYVEPTTPNDYIYECTTAGTSGGSEPTWGTTEGGTTTDGTVIWTCRIDPTIKYGIIEHTEIFNDIYPHREGTISSVDGADITKFTDSGMDFNLNDYLLSGVTAKLHFNSGNLGGYEFEVSAYNNATKEFTIIAYKDEQGYELPNATLKPAVGDKYVLLDIELPQSYIDTAEAALQAKAQIYIDDNCEPRVTYILTPDPRYFKTHFIDLEAGDFITIQDTDLGIDIMTRIVELTRSIADEYKYTLKLTDHLEVQLIQRLYDEQEDLKEKIEIGEGGDIIRARRGWRTSEELRTMVFDTDGYFDMGNIRPESVETSMLSVGAKSTQFILKEIEIEANYTSDVSKFHASAGSLIHLSIADTIRTWILSANDQTSLVDATPYYIYAKCTKDPGYTGQVIVDSVQRKFDDDPTYYYYLIGVLHSVVDGVRGVSLTYGQTIINGAFIRTGKIESTDGNTYFDLDNNVIQGKIQFITNSSGYENITDAVRLFNSEPTTPYKIGDLWAAGSGGDLKRCTTARASGAYVAGDWELASKYTDDTTADTKAKVFYQATAPAAGMITGDLWFDTDDGNKPYTYSGVAWVLNYTIIDGGYITTGSLVANQMNISNIADIGNIILGNTGYIRTSGKDSYASTVAGFWLGYDTDKYKLNIGDANKYLKWNGANLNIKGNIVITGGSGIGSLTDAGALAEKDEVANTDLGTTIISGGYLRTDLVKVKKVYVGGGTDEDIYFEDSGVRMYDAYSVHSAPVIRIYKSGYKYVEITLGPSASGIRCDDDLVLQAVSAFAKLWTTGQFGLSPLGSDPTSNLAAGQLAVVSNVLRIYNGSAWVNV